MNTIRWGILGTGWVARTLADDFAFASNAELVAVGSRQLATAQAFAKEFSVPRAYGSYRELLDDDNVDVVYVATPHPMHKDLALAAIERGKAVLMEKAFTATLAGAQEVVKAAEDKGVFVMEALWTRFLPIVAAAREIIAWGRIGDVLGVQGDLCAFRPYDPQHRLFDKALGGGAILDLGVYPISFAQSVLGSAKTVHCVGRLAPNGVDMAASMSVEYDTGGLASLACGFDAFGPGRMAVYGTSGWIDIQPRFHHPTTLSVHRQGVLPRIIEAKFTGRGYVHEIDEVTSCLLQGRTQSHIMPLSDTLEVMRVAQACVDQLGLSYEEANVDLG